MSFYFYHLQFELFSTSTPTVPQDERFIPQQPSVWVPTRGSSLFDQLPSHRRHITPQDSSRERAPIRLAEPVPLRAWSTGIVDCGSARNSSSLEDSTVLSARTARQPSRSSSPPPLRRSSISLGTAVRDWRFGPLAVESIDLFRPGGAMEERHGLGPLLPGAGPLTRARYVEANTNHTNLGWGVVHLYRDGDETSWPLLEGGPADGDAGDGDGEGTAITTLCIPAVPSYLTPADFLGFVGEKWERDIVQFRMVMTPRLNRYLVLMKARNAVAAKAWKEEYDGKMFNSMEAQVCHVLFVKSVTFQTPLIAQETNAGATASVSSSLKPFAPPTPSLVELPTCPVCLERMDDTTGLITIPCQHVFHCNCLQRWPGSGCPVCRHTNPSHLAPVDRDAAYGPAEPGSRPFGAGVPNLCEGCHSTSDLWICLICGHVGCGRYKGGHAKEHWRDTAHSFSLELETQHVWDYAGDMWVHRLLREKGGGKIFELPGHSSRGPHAATDADDDDSVPRAKLDRIGLEYAHLISSQLESQRAYYEDMMAKAADKTAKAAAEAEQAAALATAATARLGEVEGRLQGLTVDTVPQLERDLAREKARATKAQTLARSLSGSLQDEQRVNEGLLVRVAHVNDELDRLRRHVDELAGQNADLAETNRDLSVFISSQGQLKAIERDGQIEAGELEGSSATVAEQKKSGRRRKSQKG